MINNYDSVASRISSGTPHSQKQGTTSYTATKRNWISFVTVFVALFSFVFVQGQTTYYSKASATSFASTSTWGTSLDGTGAAPTSLSSADSFIIANGAALTLNADATVRNLTINSGGSLTVSANTLTVSLSSGNTANLTINNGGYLTVNSGGTINVNGNFLQNSGGVFTQNGGNINVDGNSGVAPLTTITGGSSSGKTITVASTTGILVNSVVSVTAGTGGFPANTVVTAVLSATQFTVNFTPTTVLAGATITANNSTTASLVSLTGSPSTTFLNGGTFTIVDPHSNSGTTLTTSMSPVVNASTNHTVKFGNGVSTDAALSASGFSITSASLVFGNFLIDNNVTLTNLRQVVNSGTIGLLGNLTINSGAEYRIGTTTHIAGNITNNGALQSTAATFALQSFYNGIVQPATQAQTISGNGVFRNAATAATSTANFTNIIFNNISSGGITFANANTLLCTTGGVTNTGTISGTVTFTACPAGVDLSVGTFIQGISTATPGTTAWTGGGFKNGTFRKWFATATLPTSLPSTTAGIFPFVVNGANRNFQVGGTATTITTGGTISVSYASTAGLSTVTGIDPSGTFAFDRLSNANWSVSTGDGLVATSTFLVNGAMEGIANLAAVSNAVGEPRMVQSATLGAGTHANPTGSVTAPVGNRSGIALSGTATNFYMGINNANIASLPLTAYSVQNGNWNDATTWNTGVVPTSADAVTITLGTTVTVDNSINNNASNASIIVINGTLNVSDNILNTNGTTLGYGISMGSFGILNVSGGAVVVGASGTNRWFTLTTGSSATSQLNVSGGTVIINGSLNVQTAARFSQTGGTISVDGNLDNTAANSVPSTVALVSIKSPNLNLTGGTLIIVDPHANATASRAFEYSSASSYNAGTGHTVQFGDGTSTDRGGNTGGFLVYTFVSTARLSFGNIVVSGSATSLGNRNVTMQTSSFGINGNLTVSGATGVFDMNALQLYVAGNVTVNTGAALTASGNLTFSNFFNSSATPSTNAQTLSGEGTFRNLATAATANFTSITINNNSASGVTFSGTAWNATTNATVSSTLTFTNGFLNVSGSANGLTLGISGTVPGTLAYTAGGFTSGSTFRRWVILAPIAIPAVGGQFPFLNSNFQARHAYFGSATALATAGWVAIKLNEVAGTTAASISDIYAVSARSNSNWEVSTGALAVAGTNDAQLRFKGDGIFTLATPSNLLAVGASAAALGTSTVGTGTITSPEANKSGLNTANLTQTFYVGTQNTIQSTGTGGAWGDTASWIGGVVPTCNDIVLISNGATVTVTTETASNAGLTVNFGGTLTVSGGTLTVGCTNNNAPFTNNGTLTISGGVVNVNGNIQISDGSNFTHSAGTITIDGNNGSAIGNANSVASGTPLFAIGTSVTSYGATGTTTLSGGTIIVKDPHVGSATVTSAYAVYGNLASGVNINAASAHTFQFGDGTSTDAGASTSGFVVNGFIGSGRLNFGAITLDSGTIATRLVTQTGTIAINGNLTITSGTFTQNALQTNIGGNLAVNGSTSVYLATGTTLFTNTTGTTTAAQTVAQSVSVSNSGQINNLATAPTANFTNININNSNATGVTFGALNNNSGAAGFTGASATGTIVFNGNATTTGSNALLGGTSALAAGTLTVTSGGMTPGSTYARGWTAANTGSSFTASALITTTTSQYPFIDASANARHAWIQRVAPSATGIIAVKYTDVVGTTSGLSLADGAYTVSDQANSNWTVSSFGTTPSATTYNLAITGTNAFGGSPAAANTRIMQASSFLGTHQAGTTLPQAQRTGLTFADLTAGAYYLGLAAADVPFVSITNGNWETPTTWNKNAVPTASDNATIANGTTVTVNSIAAVANSVVVNTTGNLTVSGSTLGLTTTLTNGGVVNVSGGSVSATTSVANNTGGTINVTSGALTSTTTTTNTGTINVSGGTLTSTTALTNNAASTITVSGAGTLVASTTFTNTGTFNANNGTTNIVAAATTGITNSATTGIFNVAGGTVNLGITNNTFCNRTFSNSGTLTVSSGTLNVFGNITNASGSIFNQSGGAINIDGNAGGTAANSVASGTAILQFNQLNSGINLTGGTLTIVDPHANTTASNSIGNNNGTTGTQTSTVGHTLSFGNGTSTDAGGNIVGFQVDPWTGSSFLSFGNIIVNGSTGTNRFVTGVYQLAAVGDVTVTNGSTLNLTSALVVGRNVTVDTGGTFTNGGGIAATLIASNTSSSIVFGPSTSPQIIGGGGIYRNLATSPTANLTNLIVNNTNATGVTLNVPLSVSGTLTMSSGIINTTASNILTLGTATTAGTLSATPSATTMIVGPFARTFAASRVAAGTYDATTLFPVGKGTAYTPVFVDPSTNASGAVTISGEAFATNSGTPSSDVTNLSAARWEVLTSNGFANLTNTNVRVSQSGILSSYALVQAPTAAGVYDRLSIGTSAYAAGPVLTGSGISAGALTNAGYFAYGTVAPSLPPTITGYTTAFSTVAPIALCTNGGPLVTITGTNLGTVTSVLFTGSTGLNLPGTITAKTATTLSVIAPSGVVDGGFIRVINPSGSIDSTTSFTVVIPPTIGVSAPATICAGSSTPLSATGGVTYTWAPATGLSATIGSSVTASPTVTTTYTVTGVSSDGCASTSTVLISVLPVSTAVTITKNPTSICEGGITTLTASGGTVDQNASGYSFAASADTFTPLTGSTAATVVNGDTTISAAIPLGFSFTYAGNTYTDVYASSNGFISFNALAASSNGNGIATATSSLLPLIAPLWDDLDGATGAASYLTTGTAGSRVFTFEWLNWEWNWLATGPSISFQVKLYEADGKIEFLYRSDSGTLSSPSASAGLGGTTTGNFISLSNLSTNPTISTTSETTTISAKPVTGQKYTFIRPLQPVLSWSPSTDLYTDAAATIPYAGGQNSVVYSKSTSSQTYSATSTLGTCPVSASVTVTPNALPTITLDTTTPVCNGGTSSSLSFTATTGTPNQYTIDFDAAANTAGFADITTFTAFTTSPITLVVPTGATPGTYNGTILVKNSTTGCVSATPQAFTITINTPVAITTQPSNSVSLVNTNASFTVAATGSGLTYQWQESTNNGTTWINISGATSATYTAVAVTNAMNGNLYQCIISGAAPCTSVTSNAVSLTISTTAITAQPASTTICSNGSATFTIATTGTPPTYQWQVSTNNGTSWSDISGETNTTLTVSGLTAANSLQRYRCVLSPGPINSDAAILTVNDIVAITTQPTDVTVCSNATSPTFTTVATGTGLTYQWQQRAISSGTWANVGTGTTGGTTATLTISTLTTALDGYQYQCIVTGTAPCVAQTTATATLSVTGYTVATSAASVCLGSSFTVTATPTTSSPTLTYSWVCLTTGSGATTAITSNTATITPTQLGTYIYTLTATGGACSFTTTQTIVVNALPAITTATADPTVVCAGSTVNLAATIVENVNGAINLGSGTTTSTSAGANPFYGGYGGVKTQYLIRASELTALGLAAGNITSLGIDATTVGSTLTGFGVNIGTTSLTALTTNIENVADNVYSGTFTPTLGVNTITFSSPFNWDGTSNIILSFCWSNGNTSNTASAVKVATTSFVSANARYVDSQVAADVCAYTGNTLPTGWNGASTSSSNRPNFIFSGVKATDVTSSYNWTWNIGTTTVLTTAAGTNVVPTPIAPATSVIYTVTATNPTTGCSASQNVTVSTAVAPLSMFSIVPQASSICVGESVTMYANPTGGCIPYTYSWSDGTSIVGTAVSLAVTPTSDKTYTLTITDNAGSQLVKTADVFVNNPQPLSVIPQTICANSAVFTLGATESATGNILKWYAAATGGSALATGATFITPAISATTTYYVQENAVDPELSGNGLDTSTIPNSTFNSSERGLVFTATKAFTLVSAQYYSPTLSVTNTVTVRLLDQATGTVVTTKTLSIPQGATADWYTMNLGFDIVPGTYRLLAEFTSSVNRSTSGFTYPYALGSSGSITTGYSSGVSATSYNYFHNITIQEFCAGARVPVTATLNIPTAITLSATSATICNGQTTTTAVSVATGGSGYDTYTWSPATTVIGTSTSGWTFNPTSTTAYTLTASQSQGACSYLATYTVTVNPTPTPMTISPATPAFCVNTIQPLSVSGGTVGSSVIVGTGTTTNATTAYPSPFTNYYGGTKHQMLILASELTALGLTPNLPIQSLSFEVTAVGSTFTGTLQNFQVDMAATTATVLTSTAFLPATTNVRAAASLPISVGVVNIPLNGQFTWDGVSNIVIQTSYSNVNSGTTTDFVQMTNSDPGFVSTNWYRIDSASSATILAAATPTSSGNARPNMVIANNASVNTVWSPTTNLFTNAAATIPYTGGNATAVYVKSATTGSTTYTVTSSAATGCSNSTTVTVNVNELPVVVTVNPATTCASSPVDLTAAGVTTGSSTGLTFTYWTNANASTALANPSAVVTSGTYYIKGTNASGCFVIMPVTVTVNPLPVLTITNPATVCSPATVDITSSSVITSATSGLTLTYWTDSATTTALTTASAVTTSGTYYIKAVNANGCAITMPVVVTINVATTPTGAATQTITVGVGSEATIEDIIVSGTNVIWYPTPGDAAAGTNAIPAGTQLVDGTTYFAVSVVGTCRSTALAVTVTVVLGNQSFDIKSLKYYPNPVVDILTISYNSEITSVQVYDISGRQIRNMKPNSNIVTVDLSDLATSVYVVRVFANDASSEFKVVKK